MFQDYSQTYAAAIVTLAGSIGLLLSTLNIHILPDNIQLVLSNLVTLGGIVWQIIHRYNKGDVTLGGVRK